jgi:hypothetical protein
MSENQAEARTEEERAENYRYWQARRSAIFAETLRLSVEHYGKPEGTLRDGPLLKLLRLPDGSFMILSETCGPNPLRHPVEQQS